MSYLRSPIATVSLTATIDGKESIDTFECGKDLISVEVQNGEGDRSNACTIVIHDPEWAIAAKYRDRSLKAGAIVVPANLLDKPEESSGNDATAPNLANAIEGTKGDALAKLIVQYCLANGVADDSHIAAILGTAQIETSMGQFLEEIDDGSNYAYLGSDAPYHGRGLIQVTGRSNYEKVGRLLGFEFIANPSALTKLSFAIPALVLGMRDGWYTGRSLKEYNKSTGYDWSGSRNIVNPGEGGSRRSNYVDYCIQWLARLPSLKPNPSATVNQVQTQETARSGFSSIATIGLAQTVASTATVRSQNAITNSVDDRSTEITVALGWNDGDDRISFSFWLTGISTSTSLPPRTTITGKGIRFLISSEKGRSTLSNISLRQLAQRIGDKYGVNVDIPVNAAPVEEVQRKLARSGESDYEFLSRIAASQGYLVQGDERSKILKLAPANAKGADVIKVDRTWGATLQTQDEADATRILGELPSIQSIADGESIGEGYSTTLTIPYPSIEHLKLQPGMILQIEEGAIANLPKVFARDYRIKATRWKWDGKLSGAIELYIPVRVTGKKKKSEEGAQVNGTLPGATAQKIVDVAIGWAGREFEPGATEMCMYFVRNCLRESGHPAADKVTATPIDNLPTSLGMASSLSGADCGQIITNKANVIGGDIVCYGGTYGGFGANIVTHVAIAISPTEIVDRPTASRPVQRRSINTFPNFVCATRLPEKY